MILFHMHAQNALLQWLAWVVMVTLHVQSIAHASNYFAKTYIHNAFMQLYIVLLTLTKRFYILMVELIFLAHWSQFLLLAKLHSSKHEPYS